MTDKAAQQFSCTRCGNCCRVPGYVRLAEQDVLKIADYLGMAVETFAEVHARLMPDRSGLALLEEEDGACAFLNEDGSCKIQPVKPQQCCDFPYKWRYPDMASICKGWKE
jgi:uncharacterized protein